MLEDVEGGFCLTDKRSTLNFQRSTPRIPATNPEKALENIRRKALQWGDTAFNPVSLELRFSQPYLIPASVIGEMKRGLVEKMMGQLIENHRDNRNRRRDGVHTVSTKVNPDVIPSHLMTCHHCIRYANGMCPKIIRKPVGPLFIRNGENTFRLEFDCKQCLMYVCVSLNRL